MEFIVAIVAILSVFGIPGYLIKRTLELRHERLTMRDGGPSKKELEGLREERKLLKGRIENLESIVCSVDYELNQKLNRIALENSAMGRLPAAGAASAPANPGTANPAPAASKTAAPADGTARTMTAGVQSPTPRTDELYLGSELEIGSTLAGRYKILRQLGRGGMGSVYLADDQALDEQVALKIVSAAVAVDPVQAVERFRREAQAARRISHENVIRIHDLGEVGSLLYLSMEYFAGQSLTQLLKTVGTLSEEQICDIVQQTCDGLAAAHKVGVVHRDLKPANVLIGERNAIKIIDFGLATSELLGGLTVTGQMLGTPSYMSPEQVRGEAVDVRSDIYSLGALTYRLVAGAPPFEGATPIAVGFAHLMETAEPLAQRRPGLRPAISDVVTRALAKKPADRPQSVSEFRAAFG